MSARVTGLPVQGELACPEGSVEGGCDTAQPERSAHGDILLLTQPIALSRAAPKRDSGQAGVRAWPRKTHPLQDTGLCANKGSDRSWLAQGLASVPSAPMRHVSHHEWEDGDKPWGKTKELAGRAHLGEMKDQTDGLER